MGLNIQRCFGQNLLDFPGAGHRRATLRVVLSAGSQTTNRTNLTNAEGPPLEERGRLRGEKVEDRKWKAENGRSTPWLWPVS